jgi:hypothetical protein
MERGRTVHESAQADTSMAIEPLTTLQQIREIIRKTRDRKLVRLILDLQTDVFALESEQAKLKAEIAKLKMELDLRTKMHMRPPSEYYFQEGDDVPFCPNCWESRGKAIHLQTHAYEGGEIRRECRVCKASFWDDSKGKKAKAASQQ